MCIHLLWLIHTARDRERERERNWERDRERWVYILCYVLVTLHTDREQEREWGPLGSILIFPFPVLCSVNEQLVLLLSRSASIAVNRPLERQTSE